MKHMLFHGCTAGCRRVPMLQWGKARPNGRLNTIHIWLLPACPDFHDPRASRDSDL